ncbi:MAG: type II 3-dehydroquinate dehydratase [Clostridia bacterium]|nr:type II 3-dehydroquinate dehydratase [Clostridia bacterium]
MKIIIINGPNMNLLGSRETDIYGNLTYDNLLQKITNYCEKKDIEVEFYQSNHEGNLIDKIQQTKSDAIIINPAAYSHYSIAILDALKAKNLPYVEVHLTDISKREEFRQKSITALSAIKTISGKGFDGYLEAVDLLARYLNFN